MSNQLKFKMFSAVVFSAPAIHAQGVTPARSFSIPDATTVQRFGAIESEHALSNGTVPINDTRSRQLVLLDVTLQGSTVALDS